MKKESIQKRFGKLSRPVNRNFVRITILVGMMLCAAILGQCLVNYVNNDKPDTSQFEQHWENARADEYVDDVEGYGLILEGVGVGFLHFVWGVGVVVLQIVLVWLPLILAVMIFAFACAARISHSTEGAGLLLYRILMGVSYAFVLILILLIMCASLLIVEEVPIWPLFLVILIYLILVFAWGIKDTYTKRARI